MRIQFLNYIVLTIMQVLNPTPSEPHNPTDILQRELRYGGEENYEDEVVDIQYYISEYFTMAR